MIAIRQSGILSGAHLFYKPLPFKGPAVVLMNILLLPVLGRKQGSTPLCVSSLLHLVPPRKTQHLDGPSLGRDRSCKGVHAHVYLPIVKGIYTL